MTRALKVALALSLPWWGPLPLVWLVVAFACPERLPSQQPVTLPSGGSVIIRAAPLPPARRDTVWCSAGVCRPFPPGAPDTTPPTSTAKGIGVGPFNATVGSLGTLFINANSPGGLKSSLANATGYGICAAPTGGKHAQYMTNGRFDIAKWKTKIDAYRADSATWRKAWQAGKLPCVSVNDEPQCSSCWGGTPIPWNTVAQMACYARPIFGGAPIATRTNPRQIPAGTACVELVVGQFDYSMGNPKVWATAELAAAKAKGLMWLGGVNVENGGKVVAGCQKSVTRTGECRMAGADLIAAIQALGADSSRTCGSSMWFGDAAQYADYVARTDNRATLNTLIAWGRTRPRPRRCGG